MGMVIKYAPRIERTACCCCSCSLRTATIVIGFLILAGSFAYAIFQGVRLSYGIPGKEATYVIFYYRLLGLFDGGIFGIFSTSLLLYGVLKKKTVFMVPYIICGLMALIGGVIGVIVAGIRFIIFFGPIGTLVFVIGGIVLALGMYSWVIIYSYYRQLEERNTRTEDQISNFAPPDPPPCEYQKYETQQTDALGIA